MYRVVIATEDPKYIISKGWLHKYSPKPARGVQLRCGKLIDNMYSIKMVFPLFSIAIRCQNYTLWQLSVPLLPSRIVL